MKHLIVVVLIVGYHYEFSESRQVDGLNRCTTQVCKSNGKCTQLDIDCIHGTCRDEECDCYHCWGGESCDTLVDRHPPKFSQSTYELDITRDTNVIISDITASDDDLHLCNDPDRCHCADFLFSIIHGNNDDVFKIDRSTGLIRADTTQLHGSHHTLIVQVKSVDGKFSDNATVSLIIRSLEPEPASQVFNTFDDSTEDDWDFSYDNLYRASRVRRAPTGPVTTHHFELLEIPTPAPGAITHVKVGNCVNFTQSIWLPPGTDSIRAEFFTSELKGAHMVMCKPRTPSIGSQLTVINGGVLSTRDAKMADYRFDRAVMEFGDVTSVSSSSPSDNEISVDFKVCPRNHHSMTNNSIHWVSVGVEYENGAKIWVGQIALRLLIPAAVAMPTAPTASFTGPASLNSGDVGVFVLKLGVYHASAVASVFYTVATNDSSIMSICDIRVANAGAVRDCWVHSGEEGFTVYRESDGAGTYAATLELGDILTPQGLNLPNTDYEMEIELHVRVQDGATSGSHTVTAAVEVDGTAVSFPSSSAAVTINPPSAIYTTAPTGVTEVTRTSVYDDELTAVRLNITFPGTGTKNLSVFTDINGVTLGVIDDISICNVRVVESMSDVCCLETSSLLNDTNGDGLMDHAELNLGLVAVTAGSSQITVEAVLRAEPSLASSVVKQVITEVMEAPTSTSVYQKTDNINLQTGAAPTASVVNVTHGSTMHTEHLYDNTSYGFLVSIYVPPSQVIPSVSIDISVDPGLKVCSIKVDTGDNFGCETHYNENVTYSSNGASMYLGTVSNVGPTYTIHREQNTLRVLYSVTPAFTNLTAFNVYSVQTTVTHGNGMETFEGNVTYIDLNSATWSALQTQDAAPEPIVDDPDPIVDVLQVSSDLNTHTDEVIVFDVSFITPPHLIIDYDITPTVTSGAGEICSIARIEEGENVACIADGSVTLTNSSSGFTQADLLLGNIAYEPMVFPNWDKNRVRMRVAVRHTSGSGMVVGSLVVQTAQGYNSSTTNFGLSGMGPHAAPAVRSYPATFARLLSAGADITSGTAAVYQSVIRFPRDSSAASYNLKATLSFTTTQYQLCGVHITRVGYNLPCVHNENMNITRTQNSSSTQEIVVQMGVISNVARINTQPDSWDDLTAEVCVGAPTLASTPATLTLELSDGTNQQNIVPGGISITPTASLSSFDYGEVEARTMALGFSRNWQEADIGETVTFVSELKLSPNSAIKINSVQIRVPDYQSEARGTISNVRVHFIGPDIGCPDLISPTASYSSTVPNSQLNRAILSSHYVTNIGTHSRYDQQFRKSKPTDGVVQIAFDVHLADHPDNLNNGFINFTTTYYTVSHNGSRNVVADGAILVRQGTRPRILLATSMMTNNFQNVTPGTQLQMKIEAYHDNSISRAHAKDMKVICHLPEFVNFDGLGSVIDGLQPSAQLATYGFNPPVFSVSNFLFSDHLNFTFNFTIKEVTGLEPGQQNLPVTVPCEVQHQQLDRSSPYPYPILSQPSGSPMFVTDYQFNIPECSEPLGIESGSIEDCQMSASSWETGHHATDARLNVGTGWRSGYRGAPFLHTDYVQVNLGNTTRVAAIAFQPGTSGVADFPTEVELQYSYRGIIWYTYHATLNLTTNSPLSVNDIVRVPLDSPPEVRYVRLIPKNTTSQGTRKSFRFELYGCVREEDVSRSEVCHLDYEPVNSTLNYSRAVLVNPDNTDVYVCMDSSDLDYQYRDIYCSFTPDDGATWYPTADILERIAFYDPNNGRYYGYARGNKAHLYSQLNSTSDFHVIPTSVFSQAEAQATSIYSVTAIPYIDLSVTPIQIQRGSDVFEARMDGLYLQPSGGTFRLIGYWVDSTW